MKRAVVIAIGLVAVLILSVVINNRNIQPRAIDAGNGQEFFLRSSVGRELVINLDANPTTGYSWQEEYDNSFLKLASAEYNPSANDSGLVGGGGIQTYRFKTLKTGQTRMTLSYKRPWEQQSIDSKIFNITID